MVCHRQRLNEHRIAANDKHYKVYTTLLLINDYLV